MIFAPSTMVPLLRSVYRYSDIARATAWRQLLYRFYRCGSIHRGRVRTLPAELVVLMSRRCFLNCATCGTKALYGSDERFSDFLDFTYLRRMADELACWRTPVYVKLTGGEPSLHPRFFEVLEYFQYRRVPIRLSTNGLMFRNRERAWRLVDAGVDVITISIDGAPQDHNRIRKGKRHYQLLMEAIANIQERRRQKNTPKPMIQVATIISQQNHAHLAEFVRGLDEVGIDWLQLGFCQYVRDPQGLRSQEVCRRLGGLGDDKWKFWRDNPLANMDLDPQVVEEQLREVFSQPHPFPISMLNIGGRTAQHIYDYHCTDKLIHHSLCANPYVSMVILAPGWACFCIDFPQFFYGDVREASLPEIWFSPRAQQFRRRFWDYYQSQGENMPQCLRCGWRFW